MRASRLINMVLLLQARREMTAAELATELEVSERTVARDAVALGAAGIPVYTERGPAGGYRLLDGYRTRLTGIARTEAEALFLSGVPSALREMGLADAASTARLKVTAALSPGLGDAPNSAAQRFHLDAPGWWHEPEAPRPLPALAEAVWDDRRVLVRYRRQSNDREPEEVLRELEPYGLVLKAGVWYLVAKPRAERAERLEAAGGGQPSGAAGWRVYRVDRFLSVSPRHRPHEGNPAYPACSTYSTCSTYPAHTEQQENADGRRGDGHPANPGRRDHNGRQASEGGSEGETAGLGPGDDGRFVRDPEFSLAGFWSDQAARFARSLLREEVTVRLSPAGARALRHVTDRTAADEALAEARGRGDADEQGRLTVTLRVEGLDVAYTQLLALGAECEVVAPDVLRKQFARTADGMAELYTE